MSGEVLVVTGPTATGKTKLGVMLAKALGGEVVSADSMQIYKYMDIGTAKPTPEETEGVPHHLIGTVSPFENYSVSRYVEDASRACDGILSRGGTPVIVGGTGLYIESLISGRDFSARQEDGALRAELEAQYDDLGGEAMLKLLARYDGPRAIKLHPNDKKRIVRALEIARLGDTISGHDERTLSAPPRYSAKYIVLNYLDRSDLYTKIDLRVDKMVQKGLLDEVNFLIKMGLTPDMTAMQAIGYKEICAAITGEMTVEEAIDTVKRQSRRYAKRQISWCNRYPAALRINWPHDTEPDFEYALRVSTEFFTQRV